MIARRLFKVAEDTRPEASGGVVGDDAFLMTSFTGGSEARHLYNNLPIASYIMKNDRQLCYLLSRAAISTRARPNSANNRLTGGAMGCLDSAIARGSPDATGRPPACCMRRRRRT